MNFGVKYNFRNNEYAILETIDSFPISNDFKILFFHFNAILNISNVKFWLSKISILDLSLLKAQFFISSVLSYKTKYPNPFNGINKINESVNTNFK